MKKKTLLKVAFITMILFSAIVMAQLVHLGNSNPIWHYWINMGDVAPDQNTKPPTVLIVSPENNTVYGVDTVPLSLNISIGDSSTASYCVLEEIYCKIDWQSNNISVYEYIWDPPPWIAPPRITEFSDTVNLTGIPDGNHTMMVYAVEIGDYTLKVIQGPNGDNREFAHYYNSFNITGCSLVEFTVDTTPPKVSIHSPENKTYYSNEIQLNFTLNEKPSRIVYSLDGQNNETITGNTTLANLPYGEHNVTVYATDMAGHIGASETVYFSVEKPFPTTMVIAPIAVVSIVLVVYSVKFKKRMEKS